MTNIPLPVIDPQRTEFGFPRTICSCPACTRNCQFIPGYLIPADLERIHQHLAPTQDLLEWAKEHLLASPGALVAQKGKVFRIPTLVPARQSRGACRFWTAENKCAIHPVAPFGCAFFDDHQSSQEADERSCQGLHAVLQDRLENGLYAHVWNVLNEAGLRAPAPEILRRDLRDHTERIRHARLAEINSNPVDRQTLAGQVGQVWDAQELFRDFEIKGFLAPFVVVRRKADGQLGSLEFQHEPRLYFHFEPDSP